MEKTFQAYFLLNWKDGSVKAYRKKPNVKKVLPTQFLIRLDIVAVVPEMKEIVAHGKIEIPEHKVNQMIIDMI